MTRRSMGNRLVTGGWNAGNHYHYRDDRALARRDAQAEIVAQTTETIALCGPKKKQRRTRAECRAVAGYHRPAVHYDWKAIWASTTSCYRPACLWRPLKKSSGFRRVSPRKQGKVA